MEFKKVLKTSLKNIWPRIVNNGILILDHYNDDCSPSESDVLDSVIENMIFYSYYIDKKSKDKILIDIYNLTLYDKDKMGEVKFDKNVTSFEGKKENFIHSFLSSIRQKMIKKK